MANWRQVQARIRKAKNAPDAAQKLTELFEKTRDGMVAFELATLQEKQGNTDEAVRWLTSAAEHFRRSDWKNKVAEALTRLGAPVPASLLAGDSSAAAKLPAEKSETPRAPVLAAGEIPAHEDDDDDDDRKESANAPSSDSAATAGESSGADGAAGTGKRRRRGRRGGRGRRKKGAAAQAPGLPSQSFARSTPSETTRPAEIRRIEPTSAPAIPSAALDRRAANSDRIEHASPRAPWVRPEPEMPPLLPSERVSHGRAGEPALASRLAQLENTLRRLVSSPLHKLEEADDAPAGPGVFLLSDSDLVTSYYIEACQTLRIGLGHLLRGGRGPRTHPDGTLRARLAEYLGISESKVGDYMKKYCVVRWIQLDDAAPHFAHFAIGVLRTPLNSD
jgi:hypothetical protein